MVEQEVGSFSVISGWIKPNTSASSHRIGNLSNQPHPIFRADNFDRHIDYHDLLEGLQLASRLICRPSPLTFWHTAFHSQDEKWVDYPLYPLGEDEDHYEFRDAAKELTEQQVRDTEKALIDFASRVTFRPVATADMEGCTASTQMRHDKVRATIDISQTLLDELTRSKDDRNRYTQLMFQFARTIVHELAHAVVLTERGHEHFYWPGSVVSEEGFEVENSLFGGIIGAVLRRLDSAAKLEPYAVITPWPYLMLVGSYVHQDFRIGVRLEHSATLLADHDVFGFIDPEFSRKLFTEEFWNNDMVQRGTRALRPDVEDDNEWQEKVVDPKFYRAMTRIYDEAKPMLERKVGKKPEKEKQKVSQLCDGWERFHLAFPPTP